MQRTRRNRGGTFYEIWIDFSRFMSICTTKRIFRPFLKITTIHVAFSNLKKMLLYQEKWNYLDLITFDKF